MKKKETGHKTGETREGEIILYTTPDGAARVEVFFQDESFWLNQRRMAELFDVEVHTINYHLKEIYFSGELQEAATIRKIRIVQNEYDILNNARKVSHEVAKTLAEEEYSKFRVTQDRTFESDFEKAAKKLKRS